MNNDKMIAFYGCLIVLIYDEKFVQSSAEALIKLYAEIKSDIHAKDITMDVLRDAHKEYHNENADLDLMEALTEDAWRDLAPYMGEEEVRVIFESFTNMSGTGSETDLFVYTEKAEPLTEDPEGCVRVTMVVNDYSRLKELLRDLDDSSVEVIHSV